MKGFDWSHAKVVECEQDDDVKALLDLVRSNCPSISMIVF